MKNKIKLALSVLVISMCLIACGTKGENANKVSNERNESIEQVEIIVDFINFRDTPATSGKKLGEVHKGELYSVLDVNGDWIQIEKDGETGWIISIYNREMYVKYLDIDGKTSDKQIELEARLQNKGDIEEDLKDEDGRVVEKFSKLEWVSDVPLSDIKTIKIDDSMWRTIQTPMFITKNGDLYEYSVEKIYSNNQVCKKIETDIKFKAFYPYASDRRMSQLVSVDNQYYSDDLSLVTGYVYDIEKAFNELHPDNYADDEMGSVNYDLYFYVEDNSIYCSKFITGSRLEEAEEINELIDVIPDGEKFIKFEGNVIITDKSFYAIGIVNREDVEKYQDVEPKLGLVKFEEISDMYDEISYFNGDYIIFKDDDKYLYYRRY